MEVQAPGAGPGRLTRVAALAALALCGVAVAACGRDPAGQRGRHEDARRTPRRSCSRPRPLARARANQRDDEPKRRTKAQVVQLEGVGVDRGRAREPDGRRAQPGRPDRRRGARGAAPGARSRWRASRSTSTRPPSCRPARGPACCATAPPSRPDNAPDVVKRVILAGNEIAKFPYKWGGGHGAWRDNGYDCSGSVSFALAGAGLLGRPLTSGAVHELRRAGPRASGSRSTRTPATSSCSWPACASTRAARAGRAPAGRRTRARPRASRCATSRGCSRAQTASSAGSSSSSISRPARSSAHLDRRADQVGDHQPLEVLDALGRACRRPTGSGPPACMPGAVGRAALDHLDHLDAGVDAGGGARLRRQRARAAGDAEVGAADAAVRISARRSRAGWPR